MKPKLIPVVAIVFNCFFTWSCKTVKPENFLSAPDSWRKEVLSFPLFFAPSLSYKGEEHIRFAQGWESTDQEGYFSYVFVWVVEEDPELTSTKLNSEMKAYFTGLMKVALLSKLRFFKKLPETQASFKKMQDQERQYTGIVRFYDAFFKKEKIQLYIKVHTQYCSELHKYLVFFRLSPKKFGHTIWEDLQEVEFNHDCSSP